MAAIRAIRAWRVVRHGPPREALALESLPEPLPGPGQARVRVRSSVCNFNEVDGCHGRSLMGGALVDVSLPLVN